MDTEETLREATDEDYKELGIKMGIKVEKSK